MAFQDRSVEFSSCCLPLSRAQLKLKGKHKTPFLSHSLVEKTVVVLKADERCHDFRYHPWYRGTIHFRAHP